MDLKYNEKSHEPLILIEQVHMLQPYDPCNLMSNPSWIEFLISWGNNKYSR